MSSPNSNIISPDRWFADGINGDVLLCDPFNGVPLIAQPGGPIAPPELFTADNDLGGGFGIWRGSFEANGREQVSVGVLLTEPSDPNGLGALDDFRENMDCFPVVGYSTRRSVCREGAIKAAGLRDAKFGPNGELLPDDTYMETLFGVAADQNKLMFSFDPETDFFGQLIGRAAVALGEVEMALRAECALQDAADADGSVLGMDMVYCNELQHYGVGRSGNEMAKIWGDIGMFPPGILLIAPAEHHHLARKIQVAGDTAVNAIFARPEFEGIVEATTYPMVMENGFIPGSALGS
ncbi:MAG TPA: hypothetical protein VF809_00545 [Candidatus Saccharimonadales bacterium]